ncbi:hypothetical protein [Streptomyces griseorubiginosus]|uniref:hypothetical protein n=1 Tax=Streptomyces griseorubiginosus TaxID=67304 RepID=UPI002E80D3A3|nr:hypothetical protein [Streptomyces griseorubiginosus]WUB48482.1 hypothetical protein OHN19_36135 [Streptomyces griseorubiginosus]WUB57008.1 hypothetical protein OG942_36145 [Streptomyces griseorubiginosus]
MAGGTKSGGKKPAMPPGITASSPVHLAHRTHLDAGLAVLSSRKGGFGTTRSADRRRALVTGVPGALLRFLSTGQGTPGGRAAFRDALKEAGVDPRHVGLNSLDEMAAAFEDWAVQRAVRFHRYSAAQLAVPRRTDRLVGLLGESVIARHPGVVTTLRAQAHVQWSRAATQLADGGAEFVRGDGTLVHLEGGVLAEPTLAVRLELYEGNRWRPATDQVWPSTYTVGNRTVAHYFSLLNELKLHEVDPAQLFEVEGRVRRADAVRWTDQASGRPVGVRKEEVLFRRNVEDRVLIVGSLREQQPVRELVPRLYHQKYPYLLLDADLEIPWLRDLYKLLSR